MTEKLMSLEERLGELTDTLGKMFADERHLTRLTLREAIVELKEARAAMVSEIVEQVLLRLEAGARKH